MASASVNTVRIQGIDGDVVDVTSNALDVNIASGAGNIDIGDVSLLLDGTAADYGSGNVNTSGRTLRVTLADNDAAVTDLDIIAGIAGTHDVAAPDRGAQIHGQARLVDGGAFPFVSHEGDSTRLNCSIYGVQFTNLTTENGDHTPVVIDDTGQVATPGMVNVGGEYRASATTYTDGDATILQSDINGALLIDVLNGGVLESAVDGIETVLGTIDSDTSTLVGCVGTTGNAGPAKVMSVGGTTSLGVVKELFTDTSGRLNIAGSYIDDADFTLGSSAGVAVMGYAGTQSITADDVGVLACNTSGHLICEVVGDVAENENAAGNPVLVGGRYDSSDRTLGDTDVGAIALNDHAYVRIDWEGGIISNTGILQAVGDVYTGTDRMIHVSGAVRNDSLAALANVADGDWTQAQVDAQGALYTTHGITGMTHGVNADIDTSAEQLDGSTSGLDVACKRIDLQARSTNAGTIYVGGADTIGSGTGGIALRAGDLYSIDINNLNDIWLEADINNQRIDYIYYT